MAILVILQSTDEVHGTIQELFNKLEALYPGLYSQERQYGWDVWATQDANIRGEMAIACIVCHDDYRDGPSDHATNWAVNHSS